MIWIICYEDASVARKLVTQVAVEVAQVFMENAEGNEPSGEKGYIPVQTHRRVPFIPKDRREGQARRNKRSMGAWGCFFM